MARKGSRKSSSRRSAAPRGRLTKRGFVRKSRRTPSRRVGVQAAARPRTKVSQLPSSKRSEINKQRRANAAKDRKPLKSQWTRRTKTGKVVTVRRKKFFR